MTFSYDRTWADMVAMARANGSLLATIAGAFLFFPAFAFWIYAPIPKPTGNPNDALRLVTAYYRGVWPGFVAISVASAFGQSAMFSLLLDRRQLTVGEAMAVAGRMLPVYFLMLVVVQLLTLFGFLVFLVPGIYLMGRFAVIAPAMIGERIPDPLTAIRAGWAYTTGMGWRIAGFLLLVTLAGWIGLSAFGAVLGAVLKSILPQSLDIVGQATVDALSGAGLATVMAVLSAAIYRQLRADADPLRTIFS